MRFGGKKPQASDVAARKIRVLIVDDEIGTRRSLEAVLRIETDMEVVGVSGDGADAIAFVQREEPDVVVVDLRLPKMDGIEVAEAIASRCGVVMVTGSTEFGDKTNAMNVVDAFLGKPVEPKRLVEAVRKANKVADARRRLLPRRVRS